MIAALLRALSSRRYSVRWNADRRCLYRRFHSARINDDARAFVAANSKGNRA